MKTLDNILSQFILRNIKSNEDLTYQLLVHIIYCCQGLLHCFPKSKTFFVILIFVVGVSTEKWMEY